jgi:hypothetical protein
VSRSLSISALGALLLVAACGDNLAAPAPLVYTEAPGGAIRLIKDPASNQTKMVLDLVVGAQPLTGYSTGFDLPLDRDKVRLVSFTPGTALAPGAEPSIAMALMPTTGPLKGMLVTAQSQKATGTGAVTTDTTLAPGTQLFSFELDLIENAPAGVVFDGLAAGFALPSGGLRDRAGNTVVNARDVAIGKLEVVY